MGLLLLFLTTVVFAGSTPTTTTVQSSLNPSHFGDEVTFGVNVQRPPFHSVPSSGTVTFTDGGVVIGTAQLLEGGTIFTTSSLAPGSHSIVATYEGNSEFAGSSSDPLTQIVLAPPPAVTQTSLSSSRNPSTVNDLVTLFASVTSPAGAVSGNVTFTDGSMTLGSASVANGVASITTFFTMAGSHLITATYEGTPSFEPSSAVLTQFVESPSAATTITLTSSRNPSQAGEAVTLTAHVSSEEGTPSGVVAFRDGATLLGSAVLSSGSASFMTVFAAGVHPLTAVYGGGGGFSDSSAALTQVVSLARRRPAGH